MYRLECFKALRARAYTQMMLSVPSRNLSSPLGLLQLPYYTDMNKLSMKFGANGGIRTHTTFRPQAPQACASTSSATFAFLGGGTVALQSLLLPVKRTSYPSLYKGKKPKVLGHSGRGLNATATTRPSSRDSVRVT